MSVPPAKRVEIPQEWLEEIHADEEFFCNVTAEEMAQYGGKWIATKGGKVVAFAPTLAELDDQLMQMGIRSACTSFIEDPDYVYIYAFH